ncbi:hypothetical protein CHUAL_005788 [Chamberlinius hualienensis]
MEIKQRLAILFACVAIGFYNREYLPVLLSIGGYGSAVIFGLVFGAGIGLFTGDIHRTVVNDDPLAGKLLHELLNVKQNRIEKQQHQMFSCVGQTVFTRSIDSAIDEFVNLILRDFVLSWLKPLVTDSDLISPELRDDIWITLANLNDRLVKIDELKLITHDVPEYLCRHYQRIRQASNSMNSKEKKPVILLRPYLASKEREIDFLRKVSELIITQLAPKSYSQSSPLKHLIREIIAGSVLYPAINMLCDPDFINLKLTDYLQHHREVLEQHKQSYCYAATYESFIKMIHECSNVEQLRHVKSNITTEIFQATIINNLKKSKGIDVEKEFISARNAKGDLLQSRNLKRYLNQLNFAKAACEKQMKLLGRTNDSSTDCVSQSSFTSETDYCSEELVLPYEKLVESDFARCFFLKFLLREDSRFLLEFYVAVEELKDCDKTKQHELGSEIYQTYIPQISNIMKLDRSILKGMESFLMGNKGPEAFVQAQELVYKYVEERYYPSFIVSDVYRHMLIDAKRIGIEFATEASCQTADSPDVFNTDAEEPITIGSPQTSNIPLSHQTTFARTRLDQLTDKLSTKIRALKALQNSSMIESKSQVTNMLEKEIQEMKAEKKMLVEHIETTDLWIENIGKWAVDVHSVEMVEEKDKQIPYFVLVVRLDEAEDLINDDVDEVDDDQEPTSENKGWVVKRKLSHFIELSQRLSQIGSWVKSLDLPKEIKTKSKGNEKANLDSAMGALNNFMEMILQDEKLNKSELLYSFLSPSADHLKQIAPSQKKSKFFFANLFKSGSNQSSSQEGDSDDDELLFFDDIDSSSKDDRIAEPLYSLLAEIFDMRSVGNVLRRTLITFVQITFGHTINREIRDTVSWIFSESMIVYYINLVKESIWSGGHLAISKAPRSDEQKLETRLQAQQQLLSSVPEIFSSLLGHQNTKKGIKKIFESLQDLRLNKQIFYELLELLVIEIFPELKATEKQQ